VAPAAAAAPVRLRQAVIAAHDLDGVAARLRAALGLREPFADPAVSHFGLRNAVFALGDTFLEVVSPVTERTAAGRLLARRGGDCGYMLMFQTADLAAARERARACGVREVFGVEASDMAEVHLHPSDMRGAIVSLSQPRPAMSWRWGGPDWPSRSAPLTIAGATVAVADPDAVAARWQAVLGELPDGLRVVGDPAEPGLVEIDVAIDRTGVPAARAALELARVKVQVKQA
jgi:hypothetical protein